MQLGLVDNPPPAGATLALLVRAAKLRTERRARQGMGAGRLRLGVERATDNLTYHVFRKAFELLV